MRAVAVVCWSALTFIGRDVILNANGDFFFEKSRRTFFQLSNDVLLETPSLRSSCNEIMGSVTDLSPCGDEGLTCSATRRRSRLLP